MNETPNVVVIIWDAVRASNTSLDGYERETTPNLMNIAEESVTFTEARSTASWTLPSHASIFTGLYPRQHGTTTSDLKFRMSDRHLAAQLSNAGYETGLFTSNTYLSTPTFGMTSAFDFLFSNPENMLFQDGIDPDAFAKQHGAGSYIEFLRASLAHDYPVRSLLNGVSKKVKSLGSDSSRSSSEAQTYVDGFLDWVDRIDGPFFGFVNLMDAHAPYRPPEEHTEYVGEGYAKIPQTPPWIYLSGQEPTENLSTLKGLYDGCISYLDTQLGYLYRHLDKRNLLEDTVLVVAGDHGEAFGEPAEACRDGILYGHMQGVEEVLLRVPLVIRFPDGRHGGEHVTDLVSLKDLYYTLLVETGIDSPRDETKLLYPDTPAPEWLLAEWEGFAENARTGATEHGVDLGQYDQNMYAYYENDEERPLKFVKNDEECQCAWRLRNGSVGDKLPEQQRNALQQRFAERVDSLQRMTERASRDVEISEATRQDLENLGYV